jgi:hypothetical protein
LCHPVDRCFVARQLHLEDDLAADHRSILGRDLDADLDGGFLTGRA